LMTEPSGVPHFPRISIITSSYTLDRLQDIMELIDSISAQTYKYIETLIVTERSPQLSEKVREYMSTNGYKGMRVLVNNGEWGASAARNLALDEAGGDIIAFVDDDAVLFPDWAEATVAAYAGDGSVIGLTGPILPRWETKADWFPRELYWVFSCTYWDTAVRMRVRNGYGTNLSFQGEIFRTGTRFLTTLGVKGRGTQGWQEPGGEELELSLRIQRATGKYIIYDPGVRVWHKVYRYRLGAGFMAKRAYWEGYAKAMLKRRYRPAAGEAVLSTEYQLLRRILFRLLPSAFGRLFYRPLTGWHQLRVTGLVLVCVAEGYLGYWRSSLRGQARRYDAGLSP
jgi:glycosyltransferase involved in cell wall biosynthesis